MPGPAREIDLWPRISVVIPALNESLNLPHVFAQIPEGSDEVILVDRHSVDDTVAVARNPRADVRLVKQTRKDKDNARACGFAAATGVVIVIVDADASADSRAIPQLVQTLLDGADFAKGTRFVKGGGSAGVSNLNAVSEGLRMLRVILREYMRRRRPMVLVPNDPDRPPVKDYSMPGGVNDRSSDQPKQPVSLVTDMDMEHSVQQASTDLAASVVVCVYTEERWSQIERALSSIAEQMVRPGQVVVVVDHNSALCQRLATQYPDLEVIPNKFERGLSGARNAGIAHAKGEVVVFLDDDAYADPRWLQSLLACYDDESVLGAGGLVLPDWSPADRPGWLPEEFLWVVGCSYQGLPEIKAEVRNPIGANMSFRRTVFDRAGYFDSSVGRNAKVTRPIGCEETEFSIRLHQVSPGGRIIYEPCAVVYHHVDDSRRTWRYFLDRCYAEGFSKARVAKLSGISSALSAERTYVIHAVQQACYREFSGLCRTGSKDALGRLAALLLGVSWTAAGFVGASVGRIGFLSRGKRRARWR